MDFGIGRIVELIGEEVAPIAGEQVLGFGNGSAHPLGSGGEDQTRTQGFHQQFALQAGSLGHDDGALIAAGCGHKRQTDAGVATGGFQNN